MVTKVFSGIYSLKTDVFGGQGGIRTHGELPPTTVFKTVALNHSATCPLTMRPLASAVWDGKLR